MADGVPDYKPDNIPVIDERPMKTIDANLTALVVERDRLRAALEWYARAGGTAGTIEAADRGDIDLARVAEVLTEDCGERARTALKPTQES